MSFYQTGVSLLVEAWKSVKVPEEEYTKSSLLYVLVYTVPMSTLYVPNGCELNNLDDDRSFVCKDYNFWENYAQEACLKRSMRFQSYLPLKPCIKQGDFTSLHFTAAKFVCCLNSNLRSSVDGNNSFSHEIHGLDAKTSSVENVIDGDKTLADYLSFSSQKSSSGLLIPERERYSQAKLAVSNDLRRREKVLKQEFSDAESLISAQDWRNNPIKSQIAEDSLIQEFRTKFVGLENESERNRKSLEVVHQQRIETQMRERRTAIVDAWARALNIENPNNFTLFETLRHLIQVIEHDRNHFIKRYEHLRTTDPSEAIQQMPSIKENLAKLDTLLNQSLEKLNMHPKLKPELLAYANHFKRDKYAQLEAESKAISVANIALPEIVKLPTFQEQASLKAEKVVAKYRHHLESLPLDKTINYSLNKNQNEQTSLPEKLVTSSSHFNSSGRKGYSNWHHMKMTLTTPSIGNFVDAKEGILNTVDYSLHTSRLTENSSYTNNDQNMDNKTKVQYNPNQKPATIVLNSTQLTNNASVLSFMNISKQIPVNKSAYISLIIIGIIFGCTCLFLVTRRYFNSIRYNRKGYTLTVVEVDEVIAPKVNHSPEFLPVRQSRLRGKTPTSIGKHNGDVIHDWQMSGYENPAYKFTSNNATERFTSFPGVGVFHQDNSFDDFEI
ncbi:unnamed protein product [Heterobilharzia americana]|nr:unnamed protein product [Heterobilharzia americana]CAH8476310.1 unnamed protein product [Heterobilharzia americana]